MLSKKSCSIILFFIIFSCKEGVVSNFVEKPVHENIVLIFNNAPEQKLIPAPNGIGVSTFFKNTGSYFDGFDVHLINPERNKIADTIVLTPKIDIIELNLEDGKYDNYRYLLKKGDTITFDYVDLIPKASMDGIDKNILNYDVLLEKKLKKRYSEKIKFIHPLPFVTYTESDDLQSHKTKFIEFKNKSGELMLNDLKKEEFFLDSLFTKNKIPDYLYNYRKDLIKIYKWHYLVEYPLLTNNKIDSIVSNSDNYLHIKLYRDLIVKLISVRYKLKSIHGENKFYGKDSKQAFDSILISSSINSKIKDFLLFEKLKLINKDFSNEDFNKYYSLFKSTVQDSSLINLVNKRYLIDYEKLKKETKRVILSNLKNEKFYLDSIINKNKGNLIYVDFWASWCAPCRAAMPDSKALQNQLKNKDIVFVYISIDKDLDQWKKASGDEGLISHPNSYIAINYPKANFFKELDLRSIPRYIIFNKNGDLSYSNAPSPSSENIRDVLDQYILE